MALTISGNYTFSGNLTVQGGQSTAAPRLGGLIGGLGMLGGSSNNLYASAASGVDSSGNFYLLGNTAASAYDAVLAKYNSAGVIQWQRRFTNAQGGGVGNLAVDTSGNSYTTVYASGAPINVMKIDTTGAITWQRKLAVSGINLYGGQTAVDASGNVYIAGTYSDGANNNDRVFTAKFDSTGAIQWQRRYGPTTGGMKIVNPRGIAPDASGNVFVLGQDQYYTFILLKYNSSGTLQWQKSILDGGAYYNNNATGIKIDSSGNIIIVGTTNIYGIGIVLKLDSTGTNILWQKKLGGDPVGSAYYSYIVYNYGMNLDGLDNVYVAAQSSQGGLLVKYNSSGVLQWQNAMTNVGNFNGVAVNSANDTIYVTGQPMFAKLPADGSMYGTYTLGSVSHTFSAATQAEGLGGLWSTPTTTLSYPETTGGATESAASISVATSAFTATTVTLT